MERPGAGRAGQMFVVDCILCAFAARICTICPPCLLLFFLPVGLARQMTVIDHSAERDAGEEARKMHTKELEEALVAHNSLVFHPRGCWHAEARRGDWADVGGGGGFVVALALILSSEGEASVMGVPPPSSFALFLVAFRARLVSPSPVPP